MFLKTNLFGACKDNMLIFQKDLSKGVLHAPIGDDLTPCSKGICGWESNWEFDS
jgi:hypothetical protein